MLRAELAPRWMLCPYPYPYPYPYAYSYP